MSNKLYKQRNVHDDDELSGLFGDHMLAMTTEDLHSKSAIAAELAFRDKTISDLNKEVERLGTLLSKKMVDESYITDISVNNGLKIDIEGGAARLLAESFCEQFIDSGAENYLEMRFGSTKRPDINLLVTLQRQEGKTPHEFRTEAEMKTEELQLKIKELQNQTTILAKKHTGLMISCSGLLGKIAAGCRVEKHQRYMLGQMHQHLQELAERFYSGDIEVVDEFLQLYCLDDHRPKDGE